MGKYKKVVGNFEAMQIPEQASFEAAKDYEQRLAKVAAWLIDQNGITDVDFGVRNGHFTYLNRWDLLPTSAWPTNWLVAEEGAKLRLYDDITFRSTFVEVN